MIMVSKIIKTKYLQHRKKSYNIANYIFNLKNINIDYYALYDYNIEWEDN